MIIAKLSKGNQDLKGLRLPLCLSGIQLGEMTFDNTKNNLRTSCLRVRMSYSMLLGFPPRLLQLMLPLQKCIGVPFEVVDTEND